MINERFHITAEDSIQILQFSLPSTLDTLEVDTLIEAVLDQLGSNSNLRWIVDLSQTEYLGSSMLGLFVNMREKIRQAGGVLILCGMSPALARIFKACCLERLFTIAKTRADAKTMAARR
ncbi:MAG TPA: STAS domain-containing protein [Tepidisphaeraceae bacterium]|jgi:anti-anti-sigma factor